MPFKDSQKRRDYMRSYMRKYFRQQQARLYQLKTNFPEVYKLIFEKPRRKKRRRKR